MFVRRSVLSAAILVAATGALYVATPFVLRSVRWAPHKEAVEEWAAAVKRQPKHGESKHVQFANGQWFSVHTSEVDVDVDGFSTIYSGQQIHSDGFYVVPPGKWVRDISEVIPVWDEHLN